MKKKLLSSVAILIALLVCLGGCSQQKSEYTDTVKWINTTYAILTHANSSDIDLIGGMSKNALNKELVLGLLKDSWDITDRVSADEALAWLLDEGHRIDFAAEIEILKEEDLLDMPIDGLKQFIIDNKIESGDAILSMVKAHNAYGEDAILAWDYCRALQLLGYYFVADLYTEQEVLDKSLEIAKELQTKFVTWEDMSASYLYGYQYWAMDDSTDPTSDTYARIKVYEDLKSSEINPYTLDWNTELTKTW